jgi:hypothetical protein
MIGDRELDPVSVGGERQPCPVDGVQDLFAKLDSFERL